MIRLSHHRHSGRLLAHEHTSYALLAFLLLLTGVVLAMYTLRAGASPGPQAGSIGLSGVVPEKPPTTAATIDKPANGSRFSLSPITVSGTCPAGLLVEVFKNDIFGGSTVCDEKGNYSIDVDLLFGENSLVTRVYNSLNAPGPDSNKVTVYYDILPPQANPLLPIDFGANQMLLLTTSVFRGTFPGQELNVPIDIVGGTPPYAVNIQWGDGSNKLVPRDNNVTFNVSHTYQKPGIYQITIQGTDAAGRVAFLTVAAIINGQPDAVATATQAAPTQNQLLVLWPLYLCAATMVTSFWLGERREKHILAKRGLLLESGS